MNWYSGEIGNAINESKSKQLVFLVFTRDQEAASNEMNELWNLARVAELCNANCVCLRLDAATEPCKQFKQIYPFDAFPTTYFIGNNGFPIDVIQGPLLEESALLSKLEKVIEVHNKQKELAKAQSEAAAAAAAAATSSAAASAEGQAGQATSSKSIDDKVAQAKEKLRLIQEKKRAEEEEKERNAEIERRKVGQDVIKMKREKEEMELRRIADEKKKEKLADEQAKQRIMEKIKQDREDKQKRYAKEKEETDKAKEADRARLEAEKQQKAQADAARNSQIARIKFNLVDGATFTNQFEPTQPLSEVQEFVRQKLEEMRAPTQFTMHSTFPKREYTSQDMSSTLRDLQLAPTATLLIMPINSRSSNTVKKLTNLIPTSSGSGAGSSGSSSGAIAVVNDVVSFLFLPFTIIWGIVTSLFGFGAGAGDSNNSSVNSRPARTPVSGGASRAETSQPSVSELRRRNLGRQFGDRSNITGLHDGARDENEPRRRGDKDDNATWNGNSTQQM